MLRSRASGQQEAAPHCRRDTLQLEKASDDDVRRVAGWADLRAAGSGGSVEWRRRRQAGATTLRQRLRLGASRPPGQPVAACRALVSGPEAAPGHERTSEAACTPLWSRKQALSAQLHERQESLPSGRSSKHECRLAAAFWTLRPFDAASAGVGMATHDPRPDLPAQHRPRPGPSLELHALWTSTGSCGVRRTCPAPPHPAQPPPPPPAAHPLARPARCESRSRSRRRSAPGAAAPPARPPASPVG